MREIIVLGDVNLDIVFSDLTELPSFGREIVAGRCTVKPGGSAANVAMMLALNGCEVRFFGRVGHDRSGMLVADGFREYGLSTDDLSHADQAPTGITVSLAYPGGHRHPIGHRYPAERMYITYPGVTGTTRLEDLGDVPLRRDAHLHLASYFLLENLKAQTGELLRRAKEAGMSTSLDPGGDPAGAWDMTELGGYFQYIDYFMPNGDEIRGMTGCEDLHEAVGVFSDAVKYVVVKMGGENVVTRRSGGIDHFPAHNLQVQDQTCAGDCFDAGFLYGLSRGEGFAGCVQWGHHFGAQAVTTLGLPVQTIEEFMQSMGNGA